MKSHSLIPIALSNLRLVSHNLLRAVQFLSAAKRRRESVLGRTVDVVASQD